MLTARASQIGDVRVDECAELLREAEKIARTIGDDDVLGEVLVTAALAGTTPAASTKPSASPPSCFASAPGSAAWS